MPGLTLQNTFRNGLRPTSWMEPNTEVLVECKGLRPTKHGLVPPTPVSYPTALSNSIAAAGETVTHPFPQFFRTKGGKVLLCFRYHIYEVNTSSWALTDIRQHTGFSAPETGITPLYNGDINDVSWVQDNPATFNTTSGYHVANTAGGQGTINVVDTLQHPTQSLIVGRVYRVTVTGSISTGSAFIYVVKGGTPPYGASYWIREAKSTGAFVSTQTFIATGAVPFIVGVNQAAGITITNFKLEEMPEIPSSSAYSQWHLADIDGAFALYNGYCAVIYLSGDDTYYVDTAFYPTTGCGLRGRLITANFASSTFWKSVWQTLWQAALVDLSSTYTSGVIEQCRLSAFHVWWSSIEKGDCFMHHFPTRMATGAPSGYSLSRPMIMDIMAANEAGSHRLPSSLTVLRILEHPSGFVALGEESVSAFVPVSEPFAQFGMKPLAPVGVSGRNAGASNGKQCLFVDKSGCLWRVEPDFSLTELDYREFLAPLTYITVEYEPKWNEWYITGEYGGAALQYVLTEDGRLYQRSPIIGVLDVGGTVYGTYTSAIVTAAWETQELDLGVDGAKTLSRVALGCDFTPSTVTGGGTSLMQPPFVLWVKYRTVTGGNWYCTRVAATEDGRLLDKVTAVQFRFRLEATDNSKLNRTYSLLLGWETGGRHRLQLGPTTSP